ncbi:unnamed protein product [Prorocentrum cordatum]|uniref:Uncharacterized protein n=1 Tax=Prorocentrum cordatum TaxID=2364126 RepID=A0ABN9T4M7_9DINO|nr:unnamed protein product [Polarella glacialis]
MSKREPSAGPAGAGAAANADAPAPSAKRPRRSRLAARVKLAEDVPAQLRPDAEIIDYEFEETLAVRKERSRSDKAVEFHRLSVPEDQGAINGIENVDDIWACDDSKDWRRAHLPLRTTLSLIIEKKGCEEFALQIDHGMQATAEQSAGPPFTVSEVSEKGWRIEELYDLMSWSEVLHVIGETPKQLEINGIARRLHDQKAEVLYPVPPTDRPPLQLRVFSQGSAQSQAQRIPTNAPHVYRNQPEDILDHVVKKMFAQQGIDKCSYSQPTIDELKAQAVKMIKEEAEKKAAKVVGAAAAGLRRTSTFLLGESCTEGAGTTAAEGTPEPGDRRSAIEDGPAMEAPSTGAGASSSSAVIFCDATPCKGSEPPLPQPSPTREACTDEVSIFHSRPTPRKIQQHEVESPLGTALHWIQRSPLRHALLGEEMKRELNQLGIIKRKVCGAEASNISKHEEHLKLAIELWKVNCTQQKLTRARRDLVVATLDGAGVSWPPETQVDLLSWELKGNVMKIDEIIKAGATSDCSGTLSDGIGLYLPWRTGADTIKFDAQRPTLGKCCISDPIRADLFINFAITDRLVAWAEKGQAYQRVVLDYIRISKALLVIPEEDADLGRSSAMALSMVLKVFDVVEAVAANADTVSAATDMDVFADMEEVLAASHLTDRESVFGIVGQALSKAEPWASKFSLGLKRAKVLKHYAPGISEKIGKTTSLDITPSMEFCSKVDDIMPEVPYFTKLAGPQATECFEAALCHKINSSAEALLELVQKEPIESKSEG